MDIGEGAAAAILLMSIGQDSSLTGLVQTLYYATPFNLEQITNRLLIEDSRRTKKITDSSLYLSQSKPLYRPPQPPMAIQGHILQGLTWKTNLRYSSIST
ncbi:hypothetical protein O181_034668 [Austropuccinia psidii MF-1]|uniref:Uncharacterized protein n=1 Tax=Austropuccinia psidii MF-1 TaxID=1389203 RepID=A0A9Q3D5Y7_9BASI|nr:hypothetical protein [Austropuccinia psidii MF-1]